MRFNLSILHILSNEVQDTLQIEPWRNYSMRPLSHNIRDSHIL